MSEHARSYLCPNCGGPTSEAARHCDYCAAPIATERCGHCFHMNTPMARHCSGCGRELGLAPLPEASNTACPTCNVSLSALNEASGTLFDCSSCGGQFVEHALLRSLLEPRDELGRAVPSQVRARNPLLSKVVYRPCPACQQLMQRRNFGGTSGVIVDICAQHGVWFDVGELPSVLAFAERGGLERERSREAARNSEQRVAMRLASDAHDDQDITLTDLRAAARELRDYVVGLLKRN